MAATSETTSETSVFKLLKPQPHTSYKCIADIGVGQQSPPFGETITIHGWVEKITALNV